MPTVVGRKRVQIDFNQGALRPHSNAIKPSLTDENKKARLIFCLSKIERSLSSSSLLFHNMFNVVHIDVKWFYMTKPTKHNYLVPGENEPFRTRKSKTFITKVIFLAAVARPIFDNSDVNDIDFMEVASQDGFDIRLCFQPPNSPDLNVLDLGYFRAIQSLQEQEALHTIDELVSAKDIVIGLPKLKYVKDQLCSSCEVSKAKRSSFMTKVVPSLKGRLNLLHMDLCGPIRVASINRKKYIMVIVDDYSRYTWTLFIRSKDKTPEVQQDVLKRIQRNLQAQVTYVRIDKGTEFLNNTLNAYFKEEGIEHQTSTPRTPDQNDIVERRNRTMVEAARTMLSASKLLFFF
nr:retrovirus-related Pol polyprotein from transposon TNT 1-94 [Tanacetum cinerariifolium]